MKRYLFTIIIIFTIIQSAFAEPETVEIKTNLDTKTQKEKPTAIIRQSQQENPVIKSDMPRIQLNDKVLNYSLTNSQIPEDSIVYMETQKFYNALDPKRENNPNSYYPGLRGPNQLVVYTPSYGERTGTNEFGTEAIVENNMVVRMNGADSIIPKNGFVISGHGSAKKWITNNLQIGSKVYIDYFNHNLRVYLTPESLIFAAKTKIQEVNDIVSYYKHYSHPYNDKKANDYLDDSKKALKKAEKKPENTQEYITEAMQSLDEALKNAIPYSANELKGIWIRPVERTPEEIVKTIDRLHDSGLTDIFLETYFHGKTIYPSSYLNEKGITYQRPEFRGFDPLAIWINEAHKRNMKVHIWFESFYLGNDNPSQNPNHVLYLHPYWTNKRYTNYDNDEPMPCASEHNGYFLDPANYQVQSYLLGLIREIVEVYRPDGINLDYIRYPQTVDASYSGYLQSNWGYTSAARSEFKLIYDIDPIDITPNSKEWELWNNYRQDKITEFIKHVKEITSEYNIKLTAVIFPDLKKSRATKMQNWKVWSTNYYVDGLTPLLLTGDKNTAMLLLKDVINNINPDTYVYPGLFVTFMGGPYEDLLIQIHKTREFNTKGPVLFDYAHFNDKYADALKTRVFNKFYDSRDTKAHRKDYKPEVKYKENDRKSRKKNKTADFEES